MSARHLDPNEIRHVPVLFTPIGELLFYERVEETQQRRDTRQRSRELGSAHPQDTRWPNHKLAGIGPDDEPGWTRYYYAADRATQHLYNWELEQSDRLKPRVRQRFIVPRSELTNVVEDNLGRTYYLPDTLESVDCTAGGNVLTKAAHGLITEDPVKVTAAGSSSLALTSIYFAELVGASTFKVSASGGYPSATATVVASGTVDLAVATSIRPALPGKWYQSTCNVRPAPEILRGHYVELEVLWEHYAAGADDSILEYELDEFTGQTMPILRRKIRLSNAFNAAADVDANGLYTVVEPIDGDHAWAITRKATALAGTSRSYATVQPTSYWPRVLERLETTPLYRYVNEREVGDAVPAEQYVDRYITQPVWKRAAYRGPVRVTIEESWSSTAPTITAPTRMQPEVIEIDMVVNRYTSPECLHAAINATFTTGTSHRYVAYTTITSLNPATNVTDWPSTLVLADDVRPYRGGFLRRKATADAPT